MSVLQRAADVLNACDGSILDLMESVGLDPTVHLAGGDWRTCSFRGLDLRGLSFRNARLYQADFTDALVGGADFTGADLHQAKLHKARDWRSAILEEDQYTDLEKKAGKAQDIAALAELASRGEAMSVWQYVALIKSTLDFNAAHQIYDQMVAAGVVPNAHIFTTLMDKANDYDVAKSLMEQSATHNLVPDEAMIVTLISNARTFQEAINTLRIYESDINYKSSYAYNTVIRKAKDLNEALTVIEMMVEAGIRPIAATINSALNTPWKRSAASFKKAASLVRAAVDWNVQFREPDLAALLRRAQCREDIDEALALADLTGVPRGVHMENVLVARAGSFTEAQERYLTFAGRGIEPDVHTFYALITASHDYLDTLEALALMHSAGFDYDLQTLNRAISKAPNGKRARRLRQQIEASGGDPAAVLRGLVMIWLDGWNTRYWLDRLFPLD